MTQKEAKWTYDAVRATVAQTRKAWEGEDTVVWCATTDFNVRNFVEKKAEEFLRSKINFDTDYHLSYEMLALIQVFDPKIATDPSKISIWENANKRGRDIRLSLRPGRAFVRMLPFLKGEDVFLTAMVDDWNSCFGPASREIRLFVGDQRADFKRAYAGERVIAASGLNGVDNFNVKNLNDSCMRYSFDRLPAHPSEAYASGDFSIYWAEQGGRVAGRVVVCTKFGTCGPVYAANDAAKEALAERLAKDEISRADDWEGARLLNIRAKCGGHVIPYVDVGNHDLEEHGDFLELIYCDGDENSTATTSGVVPKGCLIGEGGCDEEECEDCGNYYDYGDMNTVLNGHRVCDDCRFHNYTFCDLSDRYVSSDDSVTVEVLVGTRYLNHHADQTEAERLGYVHCEGADLWARPERTRTTRDGDTIHVDDEDYAECQVTGDWCEKTDMVETTEGYVHEDVVNDNPDEWETSECGRWMKVMKPWPQPGTEPHPNQTSFGFAAE